ncbi:MAG: CoA transferase [Hyphomicrobiaceae bacterium]|nr:CoA transferase [Hyphomicrobiaceae bacterium]
MRPLAGIQILDLTTILSGPFCTHQLLLLGAEVIKVEKPGRGDASRYLGGVSEMNEIGLGGFFTAINAGKKSVTLDLKNKRDRQAFLELTRKSDVLVENFRPGVMGKLGLGFNQLKKHNQSLIYCSISGFGQSGPMSGLGAYDQVIQGISGLMHMTGFPDEKPCRVGFPVADIIAGLTAAMAIAATLSEPREKNACFIDISMLEAMLSAMCWPAFNALNTEVELKRVGNDNSASSPSGAFRTQDGLINIAINSQAEFERLCHVLQHPEWIDRPEYSSASRRIENRQELSKHIESILSMKKCTYWIAKFQRSKIVASEILTLKDVFDLDQIKSREFVVRSQGLHVAGGPISLPGPGFRFNGDAPAFGLTAPKLGQHTSAVLAGIHPDEHVSQC